MGLLKRGIIGSFHQISVKHLDRYLAEFQFRWNHRVAQNSFAHYRRDLCDLVAMGQDFLEGWLLKMARSTDVYSARERHLALLVRFLRLADSAP